jgi:hypothetical protein
MGGSFQVPGRACSSGILLPATRTTRSTGIVSRMRSREASQALHSTYKQFFLLKTGYSVFLPITFDDEFQRELPMLVIHSVIRGSGAALAIGSIAAIAGTRALRISPLSQGRLYEPGITSGWFIVVFVVRTAPHRSFFQPIIFAKQGTSLSLTTQLCVTNVCTTTKSGARTVLLSVSL